MTGESRFLWHHGIAHRSWDLVGGSRVPRGRRVSFTYRKVRGEEGRCACAWPSQCDSQGAAIPIPRQPGLLPAALAPPAGAGVGGGDPELEIRHVHGFYDEIAPQFDRTRHTPWPRVASFLSSLPPRSLVADVGCGNGRYLACLSAGSTVIALDRCHHLAYRADAANPSPGSTFIGDAVGVALRGGAFDAVISIAVIHHLSTAARRRQALRELVRLCRVGGSVLVYAWARLQGAESRREFAGPDELVPWTKGGVGGGKVAMRYCHLFEEGELAGLCEGVGGVEVGGEEWDTSNVCVVMRKVSDQ